MSVVKSLIKSTFKNTIGIQYLKLIQEKFPTKSESELRLKRKLFYSQFLPKNGTYFDIGANFGNRIEPIKNEGYKIIAIEPQQECVDYLTLRFSNTINIVPKGLGEKEEVKLMHISSNPVLSSFSEEWIDDTKKSGRFSKYDWNEVRKIEITTFDNLIKLYGKPDFAKIDVEGFEYEVLKGLNEPINFISLEYAAPEGIDMIKKCLLKLHDIAVNRIECNYSVGESMEWACKDWLNFEETMTLLDSDGFTNTGFGDIYIKST